MDDVSRAAQSVLSLGGGQLLHEWKSVEELGAPLTLAAMAEIADNAAMWIDRKDVSKRLEEAGVDLDQVSMSRSFEALRKRELIASPSADGPVRLRLDLFRMWLRRERPLATAIAETEK